MLQEHKKAPMDQYPADVFSLISILFELQKRGHRLRYPKIEGENQTAGILDLRGEREPAAQTTKVRNESEPTSK
jgi:hypothetical protein